MNKLNTERMNEIVPIQRLIFEIRGQQVMLDRDLAMLYGMETKVLNQAVRRNLNRFPPDFMFTLKLSEYQEVVTNCDRFAPPIIVFNSLNSQIKY